MAPSPNDNIPRWEVAGEWLTYDQTQRRSYLTTALLRHYSEKMGCCGGFHDKHFQISNLTTLAELEQEYQSEIMDASK